MNYPVRLFLGDEEVEFLEAPDILFNYTETELRNPSVVKNGYSKTVTIPGTNRNNAIFGHFYNLDRLQVYNGSLTGPGFSPYRQTNFTIYYNSDIYESGYFRLDRVVRKGHDVQYEIQLFGSLGSFFYSLAYIDNGEEGGKKELSDLIFNENNTSTEDTVIEFDITKETVRTAWNMLVGYDSTDTNDLFNTINFAPAYNGIPENFDSSKFLINQSGMPVYNSFNFNSFGFALGEGESEYTEWETFDLRSYLQRPVIRVKEVIYACANPRNNGGYTVNLDPYFFNSDNPYFWNTWATLPLLRNLDVLPTSSSEETVTAYTKENINKWLIWSGDTDATNFSVTFTPVFEPSDGYTGETVYHNHQFSSSSYSGSDYAKYAAFATATIVQAYAVNDAGTVVGTSASAYVLTSADPDDFKINNTIKYYSDYFKEISPASSPTFVFKLGYFRLINGYYVWCSENGVAQQIQMTLNTNTEFSKVYLKTSNFVGGQIAHGGSFFLWSDVEKFTYPNSTVGYFYSMLNTTASTNTSIAAARSTNRVDGSVAFYPNDFKGLNPNYEGYFSGAHITAKNLLTVGVTPCDFLLSYCKMFGLYFVKHPESKTVDILSRHNYYDRDNIVNLNTIIDTSREIQITPYTPETTYYDFYLDPVDSEAETKYENDNARAYGTHMVNTGYEFQGEHTKVFDSNIFKSAIDVLEKDKYYQQPVNGIPRLVYNGFKYTTQDGSGNKTEYDIPLAVMTGNTINPDGYSYYDLFAKPQFHTEENAPSDGSMVMLIYDKKNPTAAGFNYYLTDDTYEMFYYNDGTPCWIMTNSEYDNQGNRIGIALNTIPHFKRNHYTNGGYITYGLDIGTPNVTFVPDTFVSSGQSIYEKCWKNYISDMYSVNSRIMDCWCFVSEAPNPGWLQRFYWYDNAVWRLNKIKDWNIGKFESVNMEFTKVIDLNNYDFSAITDSPLFIITLDSYNLSYSGGTITGTVTYTEANGWTAADTLSFTWDDGTSGGFEMGDVLTPTHSSGVVDTQITLTIPANSNVYGRTLTFSIENAYDNWASVTIYQEGITEDPSITVSSETIYLDYDGTSSTVNVTSNINWTTSID